MGIFIDSTGTSSGMFFETQGKALPPQTKGFLSFLGDSLQRTFLGFPLGLWFSDMSSFFEKPSESLWCCWHWPPHGKTCQCQGRGGNVYNVQQVGGSQPTRSEVQGSRMPCSATYSERTLKIPRRQSLL